ncbi:hypothetical protein [Knoellia sp. LjRoot47]|uniref:hypothetical protein n=1 Tax=Knoellia sp. LjRoot47 TaxID=3342330 RepID=UPI003ED0AC43
MVVADGDGCDEHLWMTDAVVIAADGSHVEKSCALCGAIALVGPDELGGWV